MDVVMSAVHEAEKAIWGEQEDAPGREPVSGVKGTGTATDPYDAGNAADAPGETVENPVKSSAGDRGVGGSTTSPTGNQTLDESQSNIPRQSDKPSTAEKLEDPDRGIPRQAQEESGQIGTGEGVERRESDIPSGAPRGRETVPDAPSVSKTDQNTPSVGGQQGSVQGGAQPLAEAGSSTGGSSDDKEREKKEGDSSDAKGTGQKYVKSTGYAAEGGNFDATEPGAGREADRLREEHGEAPGKNGGKKAPDTQGQQQSSGHGHGLHLHAPNLSKVKEKLHIGKHHS